MKPTHRPPRLVPGPKELKDLTQQLGLVSHLGLIMAAAVGIGLAIGHTLDRWTGHGGLWKVVFIPVGALSGLWTVYKTVLETLERSERKGR